MVALNHFRALRSGQNDNHLKEKQYHTLKISMGVHVFTEISILSTVRRVNESRIFRNELFFNFWFSEYQKSYATRVTSVF